MLMGEAFHENAAIECEGAAEGCGAKMVEDGRYPFWSRIVLFFPWIVPCYGLGSTSALYQNPSAMRDLVLLTLLVPSILFAQVWQQLSSFPGTPRDDAASFMIGDHIYVGTGMEVGWGLTNDWYRFNMTTDTWEQIASLPASPRQYCAGFTVEGIGYLFGGIDANGALNELWSYVPAEDQWTQKTSLPAEARSACAASEGFGYGIVATGMLASGSATNEAWKYHPQTDSWEQMADVPGPARHRAAGYLANGGMTISGGADQDFNALDDVWLYPVFFEINEWMEQQAMPAPRYGHRGGSNGAVIGGASEQLVFHDDVWWSMGLDWITMPSFPGGERRGGIAHGSEAAITSYMYFGLGLQPENGDFARKNDWWKMTYTTSIAQIDTTVIDVHPNPASDRINVLNIPSNATYSIHGSVGDLVSHGRVVNGSIPINNLAAGRYTVIIELDEQILRSNFIKLP